jgi:hypothetical protein
MRDARCEHASERRTRVHRTRCAVTTEIIDSRKPTSRTRRRHDTQRGANTRGRLAPDRQRRRISRESVVQTRVRHVPARCAGRRPCFIRGEDDVVRTPAQKHAPPDRDRRQPAPVRTNRCVDLPRFSCSCLSCRLIRERVARDRRRGNRTAPAVDANLLAPFHPGVHRRFRISGKPTIGRMTPASHYSTDFL